MSWRHNTIAFGVALATIPAVFSQQTHDVTVLHQFPGSTTDGANPYGAVVFGPNGVVFGTTDAGGGPQNNGVVYSLTPPASPGGSWTQTILWSPTYGEGINPYSTLVIDGNGAIYGTLFGGANGGNGSVFALQPPAPPSATWTERVLHRFSGSPDGAGPTSGVVIGPGGILYGTTSEGGKSNAGAVYSVQLPAAPGQNVTEAVLYSFTGGTDGGNPFGPVLLGPGGVLYGTTRFGGAADYGCVFQLSPPAIAGGAWTEQVLYSFSGSPEAYPIGGVIAGANGVLYGATFGMPQSNDSYGNVYQLAPAASGGQWVYTNIHSFTSQLADAADPV
ncbi:MAG: choice-of-anchor tandem repeat GloVer-containing protein, partial [Bryobacteraceae bacterium]